ncbi:MAG: glycosyltransferase [Candidatus Scalindua sediminis]|nr:glycosyltransferase [Candidatus Scalindua sediminis]
MAVKKASLNQFEEKMKSILIVSARQFGLQKNFLEFCKMFSGKYRITYISNDLGYKKVSVDGIRTIYIRRKKGKILNRLTFLYNSLQYINNIRPAILLIGYFPLSFLLGVSGRIRNIVTIIDIRSGSIRKRWRLNNYLLRVECLFFTNISIINESLSNFLKIPKSKNYVYSVGFQKRLLTILEKTFREYNLLYVGSLVSRQLFLTIYAFDRFCNDHPELKLKYKIVGYGGLEDEEMIIQAIQNSRNSDKIIFEGYKTSDELFSDFQEFNIGISFIPDNEYFQFQPPIKTYEYLAAGMPVIATNTYENLKILSKYNSIIIHATEEGFYDGLEKMIEKASIFNSYKIQEPIRHFSWDVVSFKYEEFLRGKLSN